MKSPMTRILLDTVARPVLSEEPSYKCPTCGSQGFPRSIVQDQCEFCDGSVNGEGPTD